MEQQASSEVTRLLLEISKGGDRAALDQLLPLVYDELRKVARSHLRREHRDEHTLQPTALVHEAYLRLAGQSGNHWESRVHFFAAAAKVMRHILIDHARARMSEKRGGSDLRKLPLDEAIDISDEKSGELVALDEALKALAEFDEQKARIVELRYFGGMSNEEIAAALGIGTATVTRSWRTAKAWLQTQI
jgi:RNA polymerase sigma factor (TIGR02999 family)